LNYKKSIIEVSHAKISNRSNCIIYRPKFQRFTSNVLATVMYYDDESIFPYLINVNGKKTCATTAELSKINY
jgi:hypothetical protein